MSLRNYGVLVGRPLERRLGTTHNPHYQIHLRGAGTDYRISVNVKSQRYPSEVEYVAVEDFSHPLTADLSLLEPGFHLLVNEPGDLALDYIRGNLFDRREMKPLPFSLHGPDNDLNELLDKYVQQAIADETALIYAYGERWGPERHPDRIFGFKPGNGLHDVHMNQGNHPSFRYQDGVWRDGGLLFHFPAQAYWVGVFLKFQSQSWHTNDRTGHRIEPDRQRYQPPKVLIPGEPDYLVRIVAALVNPPGPAPEHETVTLLNASHEVIDLTGWAIADRLKNKSPLHGHLNPGATRVFPLSPPVQLGNAGGLISLLDDQGLKVHGVAYTPAQARREGRLIVF